MDSAPAVECCTNNLPAGEWRAVLDDERVRAQHCLRRCGRCHRDPFLVVDGAVVTGEDHESLLAEIEE